MSFISLHFLCFVLISLLLFEILPQKHKGSFLLLISCCFYIFAGIKIFILLLISTVVFFKLAIHMQQKNETERRKMLVSGILFQMFILFLFKLLVQYQPEGWSLLLPLGISYYSFKLVGYLIEVYFEREEPERNFTFFANYVAFFPQIVCGPIQKSKEFLPQIRGLLGSNPEMIISGMRLILYGLFKKFVVADVLGYHVNQFMEHSPNYAGIPGLLATYFIPIEVYADFSGITDIARGIGKLFGFNSPQNFSQPFNAPNIQEFWRRWHMTLTNWIRKYVFTHLQFAIRNWGQAGLFISISITMLVVALWHGVSWNWVAFGLIHSIYLGVSVLTLSYRNRTFSKYPVLKFSRTIFSRLITFHLVLFSFIFFRAENMNDIFYVLENGFVSLSNIMENLTNFEFYKSLYVKGLGLNRVELYRIFIGIFVMETIHMIQVEKWARAVFNDSPTLARWLFYCLLIILFIIYGNYYNPSFIYEFF